MNQYSIIEPDTNFDFSTLFLGPPTNPSSGVYFTKLLLNSKPMFMQSPKCISKNGFVKSGKRPYIDLLYDSTETIFANWIENLESKCVDVLHNNKENFFQNDIEKDDIECAFVSLMKLYKSGKYYMMRTFAKSSVRVYNENTNDFKQMEDIDNSINLISIIEIQGIRFTSRTFQIEVELRQAMVVNNIDPFLDECFINTQNTRNSRQLIKDDKKIIMDQNIKKEQEKTLRVEEVSIEDEDDEDENIDNINKNIENKEKPEQNNEDVLSVNQDQENKEELEQNNEDVLSVNQYQENKEENKEEQEENKEEHNQKEQKQNDMLEEINISMPQNMDELILTPPHKVHMEMFNAAKLDAYALKEKTHLAFLKMKKIKDMYGISDDDE